MKPEQDDRALVRRFLAGEEEAFRALYRVHTPGLYRLALRVAGGIPRDAEEIVQVSWIRAAENLAVFRWESSLRSWLVGIALNCAREHRRRRRREDGLFLDATARAARTAEPRDHANGIDLERAIADLPDGYREILILHDVEGYTHEEIGRLLGIEPGTSKSQLFRARRALRARLLTGTIGDEQQAL